MAVQNTYLRLNEVADPNFGHDGDSDGLHDLLDHVWVTLSEKRN